MNEQPKSKILLLIIAFLLITNITLLSFFLLNNKQDDKKRGSKNSYVSEYLEKEVGFNKAQLDNYDSISQQHRDKVKADMLALAPERKKILNTLSQNNFSDSSIFEVDNRLHEQQKRFGINMLNHLKDIRNICTLEQRARFDTGFYKIFGRRRDAHKEK